MNKENEAVRLLIDAEAGDLEPVVRKAFAAGAMPERKPRTSAGGRLATISDPG